MAYELPKEIGSFGEQQGEVSRSKLNTVARESVEA